MERTLPQCFPFSGQKIFWSSIIAHVAQVMVNPSVLYFQTANDHFDRMGRSRYLIMYGDLPGDRQTALREYEMELGQLWCRITIFSCDSQHASCMCLFSIHSKGSSIASPSPVWKVCIVFVFKGAFANDFYTSHSLLYLLSTIDLILTFVNIFFHLFFMVRIQHGALIWSDSVEFSLFWACLPVCWHYHRSKDLMHQCIPSHTRLEFA